MSHKNKQLYELLLFFFVSSNFLLIIKENLIDENALFSIFIIYGFLYSILFFQVLFLALIKKYLEKFFIYLFIFLLFFNFYSLNISLSSEFTLLNGANKIKSLLIYFVCYLFVILVFLKNIKVLKVVVFVYFILNIVFLFNIQIIIQNLFKQNEDQVEFTLDKFLQKPNIYIYSIESLVSDKIVKNHLGIDKSLYMDALKDNGFVIFKNHFSDDYSTRNSLNSLLAINQSKWKKNKKDHFSGRDNTPFFDILRKNNYKIYTGFHDSHFGAPGNNVDGYFTFRSMNIENKIYKKLYVNYCQFKMPWYHLQLFNYCEFLTFILNIDSNQKLVSLKKFENFIINFIKEDKKNNKFVIFHLLTHSHPNHSTKDWGKEFTESREKTVKIFNKLVNNIKKNDPNSLLIIIGDHGPNLLKFSKEKKFHQNILNTYNYDKKLSFVMDRYYTVGAIFDNNSICKMTTEELSKKRYTTNSMLLNSVLSCLFKNENFTSEKLIYTLPPYKNTPLDKGGKYEDFLFYE